MKRKRCWLKMGLSVKFVKTAVPVFAVPALVAALFLLLTAPTALPQVSSVSSDNSLSQGEIYNVSIIPGNPLIYEEFTISTGVRNTGDMLDSYVLDLFISKSGQVKDENSFAFSLHPKEKVVLSPTFTLVATGDYEIVAKLYDKYKSVLYDTKISKIKLASEIGLFDLLLDMLSKRVRPNEEVPLMLTIKNAGLKGTDVKVSVGIDCVEQDAYKDFFIFLKGEEEVSKHLTITACNEEGMRVITAKVSLFENTFAQSLTQIFINRTYYDFDVDFPNIIKIKQGESKAFDVSVKNTAKVSLNNLRAVVEGIPADWTKIMPSVVISIKPDETAMFIVNISVPEDAAVVEYPIKIAVGSDEALVTGGSTLKVVTGEFVGPSPASDASKEFQYLLITIIIAAAVILLVAIVVWRKLAAKKGRYIGEMLTKLKDSIGRT